MPRYASDVWQCFQTLSVENNKKRVVCIYCNFEYKNALATRLSLHISKCSKCPQEIRKKYTKDKRSPRILPSPSPLRRDDDLSLESPSTSTSEQGITNILSRNSDYHDSSTTTSSEDIDAALARAVYASGIPLSIFDSQYWKEAFRLLNSNYEVPSRYVFSNSLLDAEYERVKEDVNQKLKSSLALGLITDGWSNVLGKGVINFMITTPQPVFYKAIYPGTQRETADYISQQIIEVILEVGEHKFVVIITDNASNMKSAWQLLKVRFPNISCVGCTAHSLNLIFSDILKISALSKIIKKVMEVIKYIRRTHIVHAHFENMQQQKYGQVKCTLKLPSKTRWSGAVIMLDSYTQNREALEALVITREFTVKRDVKEVLLDENLWMEIDENLKFLKPIAAAILKAEGDKCFLSEIPPMFHSLKNEVAKEFEENTSISANDKTFILNTITNRRNFCLQPIHYAANILDPRYRGTDLTDEEVIYGSDFIRQLASYLKKDITSLLKNVCEFKTKTGHFRKSDTIWMAAHTVEPRVWWETFASGQIVSPIAIRILSVPSSSAASERNWSTFGKIHSKARNRLDKSRVSKLVSIYSNLRLRGSTFEDEESDDEADSAESTWLENIVASSSTENVTPQEDLDMEVEDPLNLGFTKETD